MSEISPPLDAVGFMFLLPGLVAFGTGVVSELTIHRRMRYDFPNADSRELGSNIFAWLSRPETARRNRALHIRACILWGIGSVLIGLAALHPGSPHNQGVAFFAIIGGGGASAFHVARCHRRWRRL